MHEFITTKEAKAALGVSEETLRRWADKRVFPSIRTPGNQRLYCIKKYLQTNNTKNPSKKTSATVDQKDDLQRQIQYMQEKFPGYQIISDIGSGLNFKRKGLQTILELSSKGLLTGGTVVAAFRDRISRFAFELVERIFQLHGVQIMVLHQEMEGSEHGELVEDLLAIINVFNCRINGKRKYKEKRKSQSEEEIASE
ncbi:hypothetical protein DUNSADRAFT_712 [Dunaliella salina]|uniref:Uncharacterized protein n=1 Tax=Dunaliella salina TaxID=3046 RepID=A0ABQ7FYF9_DUNSA|nr:hypothetical protein DUNSADRAFT_712 [Dunaliella salina]|eukprot:KAF5827400.1 hypothetical protein DUNSADRAFT_712 [Dunaliella salina]